MVATHSPTSQSPIYPGGCCPETLDYCPEWRRLARRYMAAFEAHSYGALTSDEWLWFQAELTAHSADWPGWSGEPSTGAIQRQKARQG